MYTGAAGLVGTTRAPGDTAGRDQGRACFRACRCVRTLRSGNGRRGSYHRCAARATQAIPGAGGCALELLGWWAPPEHQETPLDATRAARVSVPAGAHSFTRPRSGASRLGLTRSRLWSRLPASPGTLVVRGSPAAPTPMQEHLGWPVWLLQRNCYNLHGGVTRAPRAHAEDAPVTARIGSGRVS